MEAFEADESPSRDCDLEAVLLKFLIVLPKQH